MSPELLLKQDFLTEEEFAIMRKHAEYGSAVIGRVPGFSDVCDIIVSHHERYDGAGYPHGTAGTAIPLGGRILAVADPRACWSNARGVLHSTPW